LSNLNSLKVEKAMGRDNTINLVAIDDDPECLRLIEYALNESDLKLAATSNPDEGWDLILSLRPQIVLLDLFMPNVSGMDLLARIVELDPCIDVILLTSHYSTDSAVEAIQKGACDYLTKPMAPSELRRRIEKPLADARKRQHALELEEQLLETSRFEQMVGRSPRMLEVFSRIRRVGPHFRNALVTGSTGVGKELVARALHNLSPSSSGRFVICNCSALVETLFESELFGHVKGAFTGAGQDRIGLFEYANGGSLFLDEIGDMPLVTQSKLLRVLQNQEVLRVGSPVSRKLDVRVIAATNRDLRRQIIDKQFREDLYYRLSMVEIKVPSLAERKEDLPLLERHFLERFSKEYDKAVRNISQRAQTVLRRHSWPGNIRELENVLGNACMMAEGDTVDVRALPDYLQRMDMRPEIEFGQNPVALDHMERRYVAHVLQLMDGNKVQTARVLGISRAKLYSLLSEPSSDDGPESDK
jgi:DNA-binding NtrC family response regulator